jgi:hypothetical protein
MFYNNPFVIKNQEENVFDNEARTNSIRSHTGMKGRKSNKGSNEKGLPCSNPGFNLIEFKVSDQIWI